MGYLGRLLGIRGRTSGPPRSERGDYNDEDGVLLDPPSSARQGGGGCEMCQSSLAGGVSYLPYENGGNPDAYIVCPSCRHENVRYGFGGDD